jgi:hypothetical protein
MTEADPNSVHQQGQLDSKSDGLGNTLRQVSPIEECQLLKSLRFCKGITNNSMLSMILPSFSFLEEAVVNLGAAHNIAKKNWDDLCAYGGGAYGGGADSDEEDIKYDTDRADYNYACKVFEETSTFLQKMFYQDEDKDIMGLIVYYGYIDDSTGLHNGKKVFHTFPIPKDHPNMSEIYMKLGPRFDLDLLNRNPWFTEEFGLIK